MKGIAAQGNDFRKQFLAQIGADGVLVGARLTQERAALFGSRAPKAKPSQPIRSATAAGSRMTVYLPGSSFLRFDAAQTFIDGDFHFLLAVEIFERYTELWVAQPELVPSGVRMVCERLESVKV